METASGEVKFKIMYHSGSHVSSGKMIQVGEGTGQVFKSDAGCPTRYVFVNGIGFPLLKNEEGNYIVLK